MIHVLSIALQINLVWICYNRLKHIIHIWLRRSRQWIKHIRCMIFLSWKEISLHLFHFPSFFIFKTLSYVIFLCWHDMLGNYAGIQTWIYDDFNNLLLLLRLSILVRLCTTFLRETLKRKTTRGHLWKQDIQISEFMFMHEYRIFYSVVNCNIFAKMLVVLEEKLIDTNLY